MQALAVASLTGILDFLDALVVFVRESRARSDQWSETLASHDVDWREMDPSWVSSYLVSIYNSIRCSKQLGTNHANVEATKGELLRCATAWQGKENCWRKDYVWVQ